VDLLLAHAYHLELDPHERLVNKPYPPLGLLYIAAYLKQRGVALEVLDTTFAASAAFGERLRQRPTVVGIYVNLMTRRRALQMIREAKASGAYVVVGGPEPINYAAEYLARGADVIVDGEGEETLAELIPHLVQRGRAGLEAVRGIAYLDDDGAIRHTPERAFLKDLDALPWPDREAIALEPYLDTWKRHHGKRTLSLITARGCPYKCRWCSHSVYGFSHRHRSAVNVAEEVQHLVERYKPDMLWYADDVFTINKRFLVAYATELERRGLKLPFETITREDRLDEEVVQLLKRLGCQRIWVGAESGSQHVLDAMERKTDAGRVRQMVQLLHKNGIEAGMFIMLGYEGEGPAELQQTAECLVDSEPDTFLTTLAYPIKGTPYYEQVKERVIARLPWEESSDRDLLIAGRRSRRYYRYVTRWLVNEVAWRRGSHPLPRRAKAYVNAQIGRAGMNVFSREVEA
jgi:anaerobic magnesium-protoporphyrin IX monomethyl ester cyclase